MSEDPSLLILAELRALREHLEREAKPVVGLDAAAEVLRVGRSTVARRLARLPDDALPTRTAGEAGLWWWPSPSALRSWWAESAVRASKLPRAELEREPAAARPRRSRRDEGAPTLKDGLDAILAWRG